jgi:peptide/nickel transport system substrate-binding protein
VLLTTFLAACEGPPARAKPWRRAPDPVAAAPEGPAVDRVRAHRDDDERRAHTLRIRLPADPSGLDPLADPDREALEVVEDTVFETLVRHGPAGITPGLAESFRVTGGGNEIRFVLRPGVTFHDGKPLTALDAQFSIDAARRPASRSPRLRVALADVATVEVFGPRDLRVTLRHPDGYALRALAEVPILPAALYAGESARTDHIRAPVGTGPYRLEKWIRGDRLVLARYPGYWGPAPAIDAVELVVVPDGARALTMAREGRLDILPALIPEHWPGLAKSPGVAAAFAPIELRPARFVSGVLNLRRPPFDDVRVRRAAALLVDRMKVARDGWRGLARPSSGPVFAGGPGDAEALDPPPFDPVFALHLLDEAGWAMDKDGARARDGKRLKIALLVSGTAADPTRDLLVASLRRGGFVVELRSVAVDDYLARLRAGDFDVALVDYRGRVDESLAPLYATGGALNWGGLAAPTVDAALLAAQEPWEPAARAPLVAALARAIADEWPAIPLVVPTPHGLVARRVGGLVGHDGWFAIRDLTLAP